MSWRKVRLGDIGRVAMCKRVLKGHTAASGDIPFYKIGTFGGEANAFISSELYESLKSKYSYPQKGNVLISAAGTIGKVVLFDGCPSYFQDSNIVWLEHNGDYLSDRYLYYFLLKHEWQITQGATIQRLYNEDIRNTEINLPPLLVQQKIADFLGAYDDLIENNRRRIALLEKMARELYREYFVRRSGNSQTSFSLDQIAKFVRGRVIVKDATKPGDVPVVAGGLEPAYYHDTANTEAPVVTVSGSGANAGFARMYFEKVWASDCSWVDATTTKYIRFVYCFLKDKDAELRNAQKGAAQPHVHAKDVNALVVTADEERIAAFETIVTPLFDELANLTFQNLNLARQRDRLLPRLMSGKIDLDKLVKGEVENG